MSKSEFPVPSIKLMNFTPPPFRLAPSLLENAGVGVIATRRIAKLERLKLYADDDSAYFSDQRFQKFSKADQKLLRRYHIKCGNRWYGPVDWTRMSIGFFVNHSDTPNIEHDDEYNWYANRVIRKGEELLSNYFDLGDEAELARQKKPYSVIFRYKK